MPKPGKVLETLSLPLEFLAHLLNATLLSLDGETMLITLLLVFSASNLTVLLVNLILLLTLWSALNSASVLTI